MSSHLRRCLLIRCLRRTVVLCLLCLFAPLARILFQLPVRSIILEPQDPGTSRAESGACEARRGKAAIAAAASWLAGARRLL